MMVERQLAQNGEIDGGNAGSMGISIISSNAFNVGDDKRVHPNDAISAGSAGKEPITIIKDGITIMDRLIIGAGEMIATAILMFLGCMGCVTGLSDDGVPALQSALAFGLAVMMAIQVFGHISGCHINPVVTIAATILGYTSLIQVPIYLAGQITGAIAGFALLKLVTPERYIAHTVTISNGTESKIPGICSPALHSDITTAQAFAVEYLATLVLVFVCCGVWDHRNRERQDSIPLKFGFAVAALSMTAGPYTGAHMNPARSLAPALLNGDWDYHWLYWTAPLLAGVTGSLFYRIVFGNLPKPDEDEELRDGFL